MRKKKENWSVQHVIHPNPAQFTTEQVFSRCQCCLHFAPSGWQRHPKARNPKHIQPAHCFQRQKWNQSAPVRCQNSISKWRGRATCPAIVERIRYPAVIVCDHASLHLRRWQYLRVCKQRFLSTIVVGQFQQMMNERYQGQHLLQRWRNISNTEVLAQHG